MFKLSSAARIDLLGGIAVVALTFSIVTLVLAVRSVKYMDYVETRGLAIVDDAGETRAAPSVNEEGTTVLALLDKQGRSRLYLHVTETGEIALLGANNSDGQSVLTLGSYDRASPLLLISDDSGRTTSLTILPATGKARLHETTPDGEEVWSLTEDGFVKPDDD